MADPILDSAPSTSAKSPERRNSSILRVIIAAVAGLVALSLLINAARLQFRGSGEKPLTILETADRLNQFETLVKKYVDAHGTFPGETLEEALKALRQSGVDFASPRPAPLRMGTTPGTRHWFICGKTRRR
ncbi:hypothetical protein [Blastopirellula retiformator]|uniref:Uncharacterized protein n=1 Tax=Blastopirellula retiformator TaxID=2527970 RepID=A0A5C5V5F9_9BACT|nr:hypothetical protein [Blastopirellula retiformator]TWT32975.1 hypothetical protein Enr8_27910 [Blastopirellula retiformator]